MAETGLPQSLAEDARTRPVLLRSGAEGRTQHRPAGALGPARAGELRARLVAAHVHVGDAAVDARAHRVCGRGELGAHGVGLPGADLPSVLELVIGGSAARAQVQVWADVTGVRVGEGRHEAGARLRREVHSVIQALEGVLGIALVVPGDQAVGVRQRGAVGREPVHDGVDRFPALHPQRDRGGVQSIRQCGAQVLGVEAEGLHGPVGPGIGQLRAADPQAAFRAVGVGGQDRGDDALHLRLEDPGLEPQGRDVLQLVVAGAARSRMRVGGAQADVRLRPASGRPLGRAPDNGLAQPIGGAHEIGDDQGHMGAVCRILDHEGARVLAHVDAEPQLARGRLAQEPHAGGSAGDVPDGPTDQESAVGLLICRRRGRHGSDRRGSQRTPSDLAAGRTGGAPPPQRRGPDDGARQDRRRGRRRRGGGLGRRRALLGAWSWQAR